MTIEDRLELLERGNRRWKRATIVLFTLLGCFVSLGAANCIYGTLYAQRFVLVDKNGIQRGYLGLEGNEPVFRLFGSGGEYVSINAKGPNNRSSIYLSHQHVAALLTVNDRTATMETRAKIGNNPFRRSAVIADGGGASVLRLAHGPVSLITARTHANGGTLQARDQSGNQVQVDVP